jgi:large subunit ribosomal protein L19
VKETAMLRKAISDIEAKYVKKDAPEFRPGDTVRVHTKIKEGDKERIQIFEGVVIRHRKGQARAMFTVRKVSYGVGVERMFPVHSPRIDRIEVLGHGEIRRSRLYYLRALQGKAARLHQEEGGGASAGAAPAATPAAPTPAAPAAPAAPQG